MDRVVHACGRRGSLVRLEQGGFWDGFALVRFDGLWWAESGRDRVVAAPSRPDGCSPFETYVSPDSLTPEQTMAKSDAEAPKGALVADPELAAISRITKTLNSLDENARARVLAYLIGRYVPGRFRMTVEGQPEQSC